jgi:hypothetical protein
LPPRVPLGKLGYAVNERMKYLAIRVLCAMLALAGAARAELLQAQAPVEIGRLRLHPRIGFTAEVFHIVDQLAAWDARTHTSYVRWATDSLMLDATDSAYLKRHAALRRERGWNSGYEALFYSTTDLPLLEARGARMGLPASALREEIAILTHFKQRLAPLLFRTSPQLDSFATRLPRIRDSLEGVISPLQRLTASTAPKDVEVFLVANPLAGSRGGRYVANRIVVEVPSRPDPLASLYHELFHVLTNAHAPRIRAIAARVDLTFDELNEALAYAFPPGLGPDGPDVLARQLNASALGSHNRKIYATAVVIQPLLIEALSGRGTFADFLARVEKTLRTSRPI